MKRILKEIQTGQFAREWILENRAGRPGLQGPAAPRTRTLIEKVGRQLRRLMSWINAKEV